MNRTILRLKLIALGVFVLISIGLVSYHYLYAEPERQCEANGGWWSNAYRRCSAPVYLPLITGRKPGEGRQIQWPDMKDPTRTAKAPKPDAAPKPAPTPKA